AARDPDAVAIAKARRLLAPFVLRRRKSEVLTQLVPKQEKECLLTMSAAQQTLYIERLRLASIASTALHPSAAAAGAPRRSNRAVPSQTAASHFAELRKAANHPLLLRSHYTDAMIEQIARAAHAAHVYGEQASLAQVRAELSSASDFRLHTVCAELAESSQVRLGGLQGLMLPNEVIVDSAKMRELRRLLPELKEGGHRCLIFSQSLEMLDLLEHLLGPSGLRLHYCRLDGGTPVAERQVKIDKFQAADSKIFAFLLSTRAGGQGINLTAADTVILHDLDWNPQLDRQAVDRAHRLGQRRAVTVYKLVTASTVEESIVQLQHRKRILGNAVLDEAAPSPTGGGSAAANADAALGVESDDEVQLLDDQYDAERGRDSGGSAKINSSTMNLLLVHALGLAK
ncbi:snf2 family DNA-dependent ATPase, partial [Chrysochromulina tobinii]